MGKNLPASAGHFMFNKGMNFRRMALVSVCLNLSLTVLAIFVKPSPTDPSNSGPLVPEKRSANRGSTLLHAASERAAFLKYRRAEPALWRSIESADLSTYIENLRGVGCPEPIVQNIILEEIHRIFAQQWAA